MHEIKISADIIPRLIWVRSQADGVPPATSNGGVSIADCRRDPARNVLEKVHWRVELVFHGDTINVFGDTVTVERIGGGA